MKRGLSTIERALQMARSGDFATVAQIKRALAEEGYNLNRVGGTLVARRLRLEIEKARSNSLYQKTTR
jgi:hypothetical protein